MSHPEPLGPPDRSSIEIGEVWENPVTRERATILERPWDNPVGRATAELTAHVGARVMGEHRHPALVERFMVLEGEWTSLSPDDHARPSIERRSESTRRLKRFGDSLRQSWPDR
jgi:hypothetical protein